MKRFKKLFLLVAILSPAIVHGQASISINAEENAGTTWNFTGFYSNSNSTAVSGYLTAPTYMGPIAASQGSASLITHSFSIEGLAGGLGTGGGGSVEVKDTIRFNQSGLITFGIAPSLIAAASGNASANASVYVSFAGGGINYLDSEAITDGPSGATINTLINDGTAASGSYQNLFANLQFTVNVTAGTTYTVYTSGLAGAGPTENGANNFLPVETGFSGTGGVDPFWYLNTAAGQTYTTGSGYQIAAAPEPGPIAMLGLGLGTLLLGGLARRR